MVNFLFVLSRIFRIKSYVGFTLLQLCVSVLAFFALVCWTVTSSLVYTCVGPLKESTALAKKNNDAKYRLKRWKRNGKTIKRDAAKMTNIFIASVS